MIKKKKCFQNGFIKPNRGRKVKHQGRVSQNYSTKNLFVKIIRTKMSHSSKTV